MGAATEPHHPRQQTPKSRSTHVPSRDPSALAMEFQCSPLPHRPRRQRLTLPLAGERVAAGFPSPADDYVDAGIDLNEQLIRHPSSTFFLRVSGDSMTGAGIHDGDLLVVDRSLDPRPGRVVVAVLDGGFTLKRLVRHQGRLRLEAANPQYPALELQGCGTADLGGRNPRDPPALIQRHGPGHRPDRRQQFLCILRTSLDPALIGRPVVVLSNNDGCIVARSAEARALGIAMGTPYFKARRELEQQNVVVRSSNYALYADMSQRMMSLLEAHCEELEIYSIDEAFGRISRRRAGSCRAGRGNCAPR